MSLNDNRNYFLIIDIGRISFYMVSAGEVCIVSFPCRASLTSY